MNLKSIILTALVSFSLCSCAQNKNKTNNHKYETIVADLNIPWGFTFLPDNSILITEKSGRLIHFKNGEKTEVTGLPEIYVRGQGGLMDLALHPNYKTNGWIYFTYASPKGQGKGGNTALMRAQIKDNKLVNKTLLYKAEPNSTRGQHFGSRIVFDNQGYLYFSIGERGDRETNPQDITRDCGKIYRITENGEIPKDNPFYNVDKAKKAIYSYGHRNPQGLSIHPKTGQVWSHEHGPKGGDEINIIEKGKNYGWPEITYGKNYSGTSITEHTSLPGMEQPIHYWDPSIAPSGMSFVTSTKYPEWENVLLVGSLKFQYLNVCYLKDNTVIKEERVLNNIGRVRTIKQGPDGFIYLGVENLGIIKILPEKD